MQLALTALPIDCIQPRHGYVKFETGVTSIVAIGALPQKEENSKVLRSDLALSPIYLPYSPKRTPQAQNVLLQKHLPQPQPAWTKHTDRHQSAPSLSRNHTLRPDSPPIVSPSHNCTPILLQQAQMGKRGCRGDAAQHESTALVLMRCWAGLGWATGGGGMAGALAMDEATVFSLVFCTSRVCRGIVATSHRPVSSPLIYVRGVCEYGFRMEASAKFGA